LRRAESAREVLDSYVWGVHRQRPLAGPLAILQCLLPQASGVEVVCQVGHMHVCAGPELLHRLRGLTVHRAALRAEQFRVDRLAGKRVSECEAVVNLGHDEVRINQLPERRHERLLVAARECLQQSQVEPPPGHRAERQQLPRLRPELLCPSLHRVLD
jgi:hypothetical protein